MSTSTSAPRQHQTAACKRIEWQELYTADEFEDETCLSVKSSRTKLANNKRSQRRRLGRRQLGQVIVVECRGLQSR